MKIFLALLWFHRALSACTLDHIMAQVMDRCVCDTCSEALTCEQAKCAVGATFHSSGCSQSNVYENGVASSTAYVTGVCHTPVNVPSTSAPPSTSSNDCTENCVCSSCSKALSCEEAKCMGWEEFSSYGCSSDVNIYNGVSTSTAHHSGRCESSAVISAASESAVSLFFSAALLWFSL